MPNLPYSRAADKTAVFEDSGAAILIELGQYLVDVGGHGHTALRGGSRPSSESIEETLDSFRERLDRHFGSHPKAGMRRYVVAREGRGKGKVDFRAAKAVGVLAALHVREGQDSVPIFKVAALATPDAMPQDILEMRRLIAALGIDEVVEVSELRGLWHPSVRLAPRAMQSLYGGPQAIPIVSTGSLAAARRALGKESSKGPAPAARGNPRAKDLPSLVSGLPHLDPSELDSLLELYGMVGQRQARRAVVLGAYRHVNRLRKAILEGAADTDLPERENVLLRGPTGCGKTFMVRLLFEKVLGLPTVIADVTSMTESGYVGTDAATALTRLIMAAGGLAVAEAGVVCLDEFDKLADPAGGRQLISRFGVQRSLLKMLEPSSVIDVPLELGGHPWRAERVEFRTGRMLWIAAGAFSDWEARTGSRRRIGFGDDAAGEKARPPVTEYVRYGLMRELVGRFAVETAMDALGREEMLEILECGVVSRYERELELDGVELVVEQEALDIVTSRALARGTGARGLRAELAEALEEGCYRVYSTKGRNRMLRLYAEGGEILWEVTKQRTRRTRASEAGQIELPEGLEMLGPGTNA